MSFRTLWSAMIVATLVAAAPSCRSASPSATTASPQAAGAGSPKPQASAASSAPYQGPKVSLDVRTVEGGTEAIVTVTFGTGGWELNQDRTRVVNGVGLAYLTFVRPDKDEMVTQMLSPKKWSWRSETPFSRAEIWVNIIRRGEPTRDADYRLAARRP